MGWEFHFILPYALYAMMAGWQLHTCSADILWQATRWNTICNADKIRYLRRRRYGAKWNETEILSSLRPVPTVVRQKKNYLFERFWFRCKFFRHLLRSRTTSPSSQSLVAVSALQYARYSLSPTSVHSCEMQKCNGDDASINCIFLCRIRSEPKMPGCDSVIRFYTTRRQHEAQEQKNVCTMHMYTIKHANELHSDETKIG